MQLKRLAVCIAASFLVSTFGLATGAQAVKRFSVTGGGGQLHIGNGLALPIQAAVPNFPATPTMFPTLLIPVAGQPIVSGTVTRTQMTAGSKNAYQRKLNVPIGVLNKSAVKNTVGVKFSNPAVFAVATNLSYKWPAAPAVFDQQGGGTTAMVTGSGGTMTYSNALGRFGGAAAFAIANGDPSSPDLLAGSAVTVYLKINGITPPCTFPMTIASNGCVAGVVAASPTGTGVIGAAAGATATTMAINPAPDVVAVKLGSTVGITGTLLPGTFAGMPFPFFVASAGIPPNDATSTGGPFTTGKLVISNPAASPAEKFTIEGRDLRGASGNGTIQMVAGSLSTRVLSGANANRGWVQLTLGTLDQSEVPSMSLFGLATTVTLILLAFGYSMRRRIFA
jgi:hypothetical protein